MIQKCVYAMVGLNQRMITGHVLNGMVHL
jgi:hypothetical protein